MVYILVEHYGYDDMTTFYIVRHGQTEANRDNIIQGHIDRPLTEKGIAQAQATAEKLCDIHFDVAYSSDLLRAQRTAEIMLLERKLAIQTTSALRERNWGQYDGRQSDDFHRECAAALETFKALTEQEKMVFQFADIERNDKVVERFILFLREIAITHDGKNVLVVTHGGGMRLFLIHLGWATFETLPPGSVGNAGYMVVESDGVDFFIQDLHRIKKTDPIS